MLTGALSVASTWKGGGLSGAAGKPLSSLTSLRIKAAAWRLQICRNHSDRWIHAAAGSQTEASALVFNLTLDQIFTSGVKTWSRLSSHFVWKLFTSISNCFEF